MKNIFEQEVTNEVLGRINNLSSETQPNWGKMNVGQMLAHCNVTYEMVYTDKHPKATGFKKFLLKAMVKSAVVSDKPYKKYGRTAPQFLITDERDFQQEKKRLTDYIVRSQQDGPKFFDNRESNSFGKLTVAEWNNQFYKHLDHHLNQFGV